jgi:hypothetical protein
MGASRRALGMKCRVTRVPIVGRFSTVSWPPRLLCPLFHDGHAVMMRAGSLANADAVIGDGGRHRAVAVAQITLTSA